MDPWTENHPEGVGADVRGLVWLSDSHTMEVWTWNTSRRVYWMNAKQAVASA